MCYTSLAGQVSSFNIDLYIVFRLGSMEREDALRLISSSTLSIVGVGFCKDYFFHRVDSVLLPLFSMLCTVSYSDSHASVFLLSFHRSQQYYGPGLHGVKWTAKERV